MLHESCKLILASSLLILLLIVSNNNAHPTQFVLATPQTRARTSSCEFPAIFNFGDSNSDTGGSAASFARDGPPHGQTFFHAPAGRYSDGRLVIDFIAESLGFPYLNAYLDSMGSNFSYGANFATSGSTIRTQNTTYYSPFSLIIQARQFHRFQQRSKILRNDSSSAANLLPNEPQPEVFKNLLPKAEYFSRALYTFDIGQNDLTSVNFSNKSTDEAKAILSDILDQFKTVIKGVYAEGDGGRYFWIHNTGPLGCLPYVLDGLSPNATQMDQTGCSIPSNEVAQNFNSLLKEVVVQLRKDMPLASITFVDVYSIKYHLISHAQNLGFKDPLVACCGHGGKYNYDAHKRCGAMVMENRKEVLVGSCKDPSVKINWDGAHYTEAANKWVFDQLVDGSYSDPPVPLKRACYKH